jgi:RimJ/RimL family protein N-acetyltransferase
MLPSLTTPHLAMRPATDADLDGLWRLLTDREVRRYLCDDHVMTRAEVQAMLTDSISLWPAGMGLWLLWGEDGQQIGCIGLHPVTAGIVAHVPGLAGEVEPTIALAPEHWGKGYAAEALAAALAYGFERLGLEHLVAVVDVPNLPSHRLMLRVGFTQTGTTATGPCYPLRTYKLARSAFDAGRALPSSDL